MKKLNLILFVTLLSGCLNNPDKDPLSNKNSEKAFVRNAHSMIYNSKTSQVYLFGGANEKKVLSDLWVLDGGKWRKLHVNFSPEPRTFASLVYDRANDRLILFGGSKVLFGKTPDPQNLLNDTWQFKNEQWEKLDIDKSPSPRAESGMVYDENRQVIVLFGGYYIQNGEYFKLGDTWEFSHGEWRLVSKDGPSKRNGASMVYDTKRKSVILFGGSTADKQYGEGSGETWQWDGIKWSKLDIEQPEGVFNATIVYDKNQDRLIRFGGWNGNSRIDETWFFQHNKWTQQNTAIGPASRNHSSMIYDDSQGKIILFGGHDGKYIFGDTWEYTGQNWNKISETLPVKRVSNGH